jgi:orotate phosphoribosyltransferase
MERRKLIALGFAVGSLLGIGLYARRGREGSERIDLYFADGSLVSLHSVSPEAAPLLVHAHDALGAALREHAYLEGDFVLRSGRRSNYYLDKYRFETRPELLSALGEHIAATVSEHEPDAVRLAGPELGAVALAAAASMSSGLPFLIVRKAAKEYGTANRLEGVFEPGERVCLVEDVVTSGGAVVEALDAVREAGLECRIAVCVLDREEGGADALARRGARLVPLFRAGELLSAEKTAAKPHG